MSTPDVKRGTPRASTAATKLRLARREVRVLRTEQRRTLERLGKLVAAFRDIRDHGTRFDLTPTNQNRRPQGSFEIQSYNQGYGDAARFYCWYLTRIDKSMRDVARIALGETTWSVVAQEDYQMAKAAAENPRTTVVNIRDVGEGGDGVYIGRSGHGKAGPLGNPFHLGSRQENVANFRSWFYDKIERDLKYRALVLSAKGRQLRCFCAPLSCHGDVIAEWLNSVDKEGNPL